MIVINRLAKPGDIRRVDLSLDIVRVQTFDGQDRVYRLVSGYNVEEVKQNEDNSPIRA